MVNLIWKSLPKIAKIPKQHSIFTNLGVKNFTTRNDPKDKTLIFDSYYLVDPKEWKAVTFEG